MLYFILRQLTAGAKEESDYVISITKLPEKYTQGKVEIKLPRFSTLTLGYDIG